MSAAAVEPVPRRRASSPRRALLLAVTLALPWLVLALVELGLRAGGYGGDYPLFTPYAPQPGYLVSSPDAARRYFRGAFVPTPHVDFFRVSKPAGTYRIFFQGESSAQGFPYLHGAAPSRMLEAWLQRDLPDRDVEVVNTAFTAISSYVLLDQADAVLAQHPDAVLIYTGHNEYYGVFGAGSAGPLGRSPALVRAYLVLRHLRLVQLLENARGGARTPGDAPSDGPGAGAPDAPRSVMALMAGDQHVAFGSARYAAGVAQFRANLGALLAKYQAAGVPVFVGTLVSNERDQPPFVSGFTPGADTAAWRRAVNGAVADVARGDTAAAVAGLRAAVHVDPAPADAHYALARLLEARGDTAGARPEYRAAKERDELRFRAPEALNAVIREQAARYGATVVESQAAVERASPGGVPGHSLILEHLHPNVAGYAVIARAFYDALRARGLPAANPGAPRPTAAEPALADVPVTAVDSVVGVLRTNRLMSGWPFQPRGAVVVPAVDTLHPRTRVEALARALVLDETPWAQATDALRTEYARAGDTTRALAVSRVMAQEYRYSPQPWLDAAQLAAAARRLPEALDDARRANARRETPEGQRLAGLLALQLGDRDAALAALERASALAPGDRKAALSVTAARALPLLEGGRADPASDATRLYNLAVAYALLEQYGKARAAVAALQRAAPGDPRAADLLQRVPPA